MGLHLTGSSLTTLNNAFAASLTATAVKTSAYSAAAGDLVPVDATSGAVTVTLPTAPADRTRVAVKKIDASTNAVTVAAGGSDVFNKAGGSTSVSLTLTNQAVGLQYSGGIWYVVGDDLPLGQLDSRFVKRSAAKADGADWSTTLQAEADAAATAGGGRVVLPAGTVVGHVTVAAGVVIEGEGKDATVLQRPAGWDGPVVQSTNFATLINTGGVGTTHDMGVRNLTIDGNRSAAGFTAPVSNAIPATPTTSTATTGGTIAAGTQWYRIAPITAAGVGIASAPINQVTTGSTSTVTVNWSAVTGATGYVIYGRGFNGTWMAQVGNVTTWTDTGAVTPVPAVNFRWSANATAPAGLALYGWRPVLQNVRIKNAPGPGAYISWRNSTGAPATGATMEAICRDVHIEDSGTNNLIWDGPHDSVFHNLLAARPGQASQVSVATTDNIVVEGGGPVRFVTSHAWGQAYRAFALYGQADLTTCQAEGALGTQVMVGCPTIHINELEVFSPGTSTAQGITWGDARTSTINKVHVYGLHAYGFSSGSGAAIDVTKMSTGCTLDGTVDQTTGTVMTGTAATDAYVNLRVNGMAGAKFQVPGYNISAGVDIPGTLKNSNVASVTRRESNTGLSGFSSGLIVAGVAICQAAGTYTQARIFFTGIGSALTGAKIGVWNAAASAVLSETADFKASIVSANAWVTVALGTSVTLAVGDQVFLGFAETHTTTSVALRALGFSSTAYWPQTTAEGVLQYKGRNGGTWAGGSNTLPASLLVTEGPGTIPLIELIP